MKSDALEGCRLVDEGFNDVFIRPGGCDGCWIDWDGLIVYFMSSSWSVGFRLVDEGAIEAFMNSGTLEGC